MAHSPNNWQLNPNKWLKEWYFIEAAVTTASSSVLRLPSGVFSIIKSHFVHVQSNVPAGSKAVQNICRLVIQMATFAFHSIPFFVSFSFSILVNLNANVAQGLCSVCFSSRCERAFMQWEDREKDREEEGVKQNNMSKNKCTKDISGIFFKWNISLLLATANKNKNCG